MCSLQLFAIKILIRKLQLQGFVIVDLQAIFIIAAMYWKYADIAQNAQNISNMALEYLGISTFFFTLPPNMIFLFQSGKENKYLLSHKSSWTHKLVIPLIVLLAAGAAAPFFLLPYEKISHTCTEPLAFKAVMDYESEKFTANLYSTLVTVFTYVLPVSLLPLCLLENYRGKILEMSTGAKYFSVYFFVRKEQVTRSSMHAKDLGSIPIGANCIPRSG